MSDESDKLGKFMSAVRVKMYDRILNEDINYDADVAMLTRWVEIAEREGIYVEVGRNLNFLGLINAHVGYPSKAIDYHEQARQAFIKSDAIDYIALMQNNIGEIYRMTLQDKAAVDYYLLAIEQLNNITEGEAERFALMAHNNLGLTYLALRQFDLAENYFDVSLKRVFKSAWQHIEVFVETRYGLAEIALSRQDLAQAWEWSNIAVEYSQSQDNHRLQAAALWTQSHIAEIDPDSPNSMAFYDDQAKQILIQSPNFGGIARYLLAEAYYQKQNRQYKKANILAREAQVYYQRGNLEEVSIAVEFIADLSD